MKHILDIKKILDDIKDIKYTLIKIDADYVPKDFPKTYAIGKDLDIMVKTSDDVDKVKEKVLKWSEAYSKFSIIVIDEPFGFRIRFEEHGRLHFQLDVKYKLQEFNTQFIEGLVNSAIEENGYFKSIPRYESIIRLESFYRCKTKLYHKEYIEKNITHVKSQDIPLKLQIPIIKILLKED